MAKVTFTGDPRSDINPAVCEMFGHVFPRGMAVDVTDEKALAKLKTNSHFEVEAKRSPGRPKSTPAEVEDGPDAG